jgi:hypothetical protein
VANDEEPRESEEESGGPEEEGLSQDPFVERRRPDPSQPPEPVRILEGLLGDSDREGYKRLYFTRKLDNYAEFRTEDVVFREPIPSEQAPLVGLEATRVGIRRDATIEYTRVRAPRPVDEFDLDVRLGGAPTRAPRGDHLPTEISCAGPCVTEDNFTCFRTCFECPTSFDTCVSCGQTCGGQTCGPTCGALTCVTCGQTCGQTCVTCGGQTCGQTCGGQTCVTCGGFTCARGCFTVGARCV